MASQQQQTHLLIIEDDGGRREHPLEESYYCIGRDPSCDIRLYSQFVSRRHATLERRKDETGNSYYQIVDGHNGKPSANGLLINNKKHSQYRLEDEDRVILGPDISLTYYLLKRDAVVTAPVDEFDITLINPGMLDDD